MISIHYTESILLHNSEVSDEWMLLSTLYSRLKMLRLASKIK